MGMRFSRPLHLLPIALFALLAVGVCGACPLGDQEEPAPAPPVAPEAETPPAFPQLPEGVRKVDADAFPDDPRLEIVRKMLAAAQYENARMAAAAVLRQHPEIARGEFYLGLSLLRLKQYEEAREYLVKAGASDQAFPERLHVPHYLGWVSYHLGQFDRAWDEFLEHLKAFPNEPDSLVGLGMISAQRGDLPEAEARFHEAIAVQKGPDVNNRELSFTWIRLGDILSLQDKRVEAEKAYMEALALNANHYQTWAKLARTRDKLGKTKEAASARNEERLARERVGAGQALPAQPAPTPAPPAPK